MRVLDFTRILSGPYCALLLSDLGADVIKVERPHGGDETRHWGPPFLDEEARISTYFASLNRGKRSIDIDLASEAGQAMLERLVPAVDVVLENFRPGVAQRFGLDHERLAALQPAIVTCSISGFGRTGPYADLAGTEIVVEAMSGLMEITGPPDGDPVRFGIAMVDIATGLTAASRILAALLAARESGHGAHVDCSLYATALGVLGTLVTSYTATEAEPRRWGSHHPTVVPYGGFPAADGHLITGVVSDARWRAFCDAIERPELAEMERFATNALRVEHRSELERLIADQTRTRPLAHWLARLHAAGLLAAPIRTVGAAIDDPATRAMGLFVELLGHHGVLSPRLDGVPHAGGAQRAPAVGEDRDAVIAELLGGRAGV